MKANCFIGVRSFLERCGMRMEFRCSRRFVIWVLTPFCLVALFAVLLLVINPQISRFAYIFQSMVNGREGSHPWAALGPNPPDNYTGVWRRWHWNGKLSFEEQYVGGKLDGPFRAWDRLGHLWLETAYHEGRYHGDYVLFYEDGTTNRINHYFEGKQIGHWIHYYSNGQKREEEFFSAPGILDGEQTSWDKNGLVTSQRVWRKDEPWQGRFYFYRGTNWFREQYESGELISTTNIGPYFLWGLPATTTRQTN